MTKKDNLNSNFEDICGFDYFAQVSPIWFTRSAKVHEHEFDHKALSGVDIFRQYEFTAQELISLIREGLIPCIPPPALHPFFVNGLRNKYGPPNYIEGRVPLATGESLKPERASLKDVSNLGRFSLNPESGHWQLLFHEDLKEILGHKNWDYSIEFEQCAEGDSTINYGSFHINFELVGECYQCESACKYDPPEPVIGVEI